MPNSWDTNKPKRKFELSFLGFKFKSDDAAKMR
jgi:hypothetical protein